MPSPFRIAALLLLFAGVTNVRAAASFTETVPFVAGQGGYHTYRIPAIVRSTNGALLAFCEGRKNSSGDSGDIDIVLRRSTNNGATWLPMTLVQEEGGTAAITIGNPAPVVDETTGVIHLIFCRNNDRVFRSFSTNDGVSWSARTEITSSVKLSKWGWYATGPGHGIQLKRGTQAGRLVITCDHNTTNGVNGAHVIYSDNDGATWQLGGVNDASGGVNPNETMCVDLVTNAPDLGSRIYFNTRDQSGSANGTRGEAWSPNGGGSFDGPFTNRTSFVCPVVQGSLLRLRSFDDGGNSNRILFSCPNNTSARASISTWSSTNEAVSWSAPKLVFAGLSAYSDMARTSAGDVALLYEKGTSSAYETITLARFNEAWLDTGTLPEENPQPAFWNFEERVPGQTANTNAGAIQDVDPYGLGDNLTAQKAFSYISGSTNFGSGSALAFDGTGGLQMSDVASSNHFDFGANDSFTIEAVFRIPAGSTQTGALAAKDYGTLLPSWWLRVESGKLRFLVCDGTSQLAVTAATPVNDGLWHHAAAVRDATVPSAKLLRIYLDGILLTNLADTTAGSLANAQPLDIACFGNSTTPNLTGDIDMVRIMPRALVPQGFLGHWTQFDADGDGIPDVYERAIYGSLEVVGDSDSDGDGDSDLLEFALGTDPLSPVSTPKLVAVTGANSIIITSRQRSLPAWLTLELQTSTDLTLWQPAAEIVFSPPSAMGYINAHKRCLIPAECPQRFISGCASGCFPEPASRLCLSTRNAKFPPKSQLMPGLFQLLGLKK